MSQPSEIIQDELNIKEMFEILWKGKIIIAIITVIAIIASTIANIFIIPERYEAIASVNVAPIAIKVSALNDTVSIVDYLAKLPVMTKANYLRQAKSAQILDNTIKKLELKDTSGNYISVNSLSSMITVTDVVNTNVIEIMVNYDDPAKAALIANTLGQSFADYVAENTKVQIQEAADSIALQLSNGEKELLEKKQALNEYRSTNKNIDVLKGEASNIIGEILSYKASLQDIKIQIESDTSVLQVLESASQSNSIIPSQDYNLSIDLNNDPETVGSNQVNITPDNLSGSLLTINIIAIQTRLVSNQAKEATFEKRIPELESALTVTQTTLTDEEYKFDTVSNDMTVSQLTYSAYEQRNREVKTFSESDIGKTIITISSEASVPGGPVSPDKKKNILIVGALAFCLSVFFVLFRNYWKRAKASSPK